MNRTKANFSTMLLQKAKPRPVPSPVRRGSQTARKTSPVRLSSPRKRIRRLKRTSLTKSTVLSQVKVCIEPPSLAQAYFQCACYVKVTELIRLAAVPPDAALVQLATALLTLLAATDKDLEEWTQDPWQGFVQFLKQPGHAVLAIRRLPFFIQAGQLPRGLRVPTGTQSLSVAKKLARLVDLACRMTDEAPQKGKQLGQNERPLGLKKLNSVPEYAKGVGGLP